jgi:uncharacterized protein
VVHAFENNGFFIAVDANSGSIFSIDEVTYEILKAFPENLSGQEVMEKLGGMFDADVISEACDEIESLKEQQMLYSPDPDDSTLLKQLENNNGLKALCLHIAHGCNLACEYCFASKGDYCTGNKLMSEDVALRAVDFLARHSGNRENIEIDFFGGEPLINYEVVKRAVAYGKEIEKNTGKKFHFTLTTNGTLLDKDIIDFINQYMDNVVVSLDGRQEVHDRMRFYRDGSGSYEDIAARARELVKGRKNKDYFIRGTFTGENLDFSEDVFHIAGLGFNEVSIEPVVGSGEPFHITQEHIPAILDEYDRLAKRYLEYIKSGNRLRFYHFNLNLFKGPCIQRRIIACGAGFEYLAVSPEGHLYPCHQFVGQRQFIIGDVYEGINDINGITEEFKGCNVITKEECKKCWAKYYCSGGCHANAYFSNGSIFIPNELACIMQRKRIECAIMIELAASEDNFGDGWR